MTSRRQPTAPLGKGTRITGEQRVAMGQHLAERYAAGESIRSMAASLQRSYGWVQTLLKERGVTLRGRGGDTRPSVAVTPTPEAKRVPMPRVEPEPEPVVEDGPARPDEGSSAASGGSSKKTKKAKKAKAEKKVKKAKADKTSKQSKKNKKK